ncbi:gamma-glutamylaminecyclotransferase isoform X4 [Choloepus didactylus]|uniref:gamma-glutamylaminecyclotransferase isoform X4 n=1 Tax=Choloepus didactylus TaxID=27675 RepID=UPI00189D56FB|nr:gamma-glutamylaminecyclotransferase isoform X4 [Choloepus didactylus]
MYVSMAGAGLPRWAELLRVCFLVCVPSAPDVGRPQVRGVRRCAASAASARTSVLARIQVCASDPAAVYPDCGSRGRGAVEGQHLSRLQVAPPAAASRGASRSGARLGPGHFRSVPRARVPRRWRALRVSARRAEGGSAGNLAED